MKRYLLIIIYLLTSWAVSAQKDSLHNKKFYFSIGADIGFATPEGNLASGTWGQVAPGSSGLFYLAANAMNGIHYDIYGSVRFKNGGVMFQYGGNAFPYNQSSNYSTSAIGYGNIPLENGTFIFEEYEAGPFLSIDLETINLEFKLLFGSTVNNNFPTLSDATTNANPRVEMFQNGEGFCYDIGAKVKLIVLHNRLGVSLGIDYAGTDMTYLWYLGTMNQRGGTIQMSIGILQISAGLYLEL